MRNALSISLVCMLAACAGVSENKMHYPTTKTVNQTDVHHGVTVADPYRWLEDDVRESASVREWVDAQNAVTFAYLEQIPERERIARRLTALWDYEKHGIPFREGGRYFFFRNDGLQSQSVLYTQASLDAQPEVLLDPNTWSADGTVALAGVSVSPDARFLAYGIQDGGSDWRSWRVMDLATRETLSDELEWLKFTGVTWKRDGSGFYYSRYPAPGKGDKFQSLNHNHSVYHHRVDTPQAADTLVYTTPEHPDWGYAANVTDDGRHLVITVWVGTDDRYQIAWVDLSKTDAKPVMLISGFDHDYTLSGSDGNLLFFRTSNLAPKGRLIAIDVTRPEPANWIELIGESEHVLEDVGYVGDHFIAQYLRDARSEVRVFARDGRFVRVVDLPGVGSSSGFNGEGDNPETFYAYSSFNAPPTVYRYDVTSGVSAPFKKATVDFNADDYVVRQTFCTSQDGTRVPVFIAHHKNLRADGNNPAMLYGYGGFNITKRPEFSIVRLAWMEMGGVYALANLRGGGEYGEAWHKAGTKLQKQNVFDDFIAAAECLIDEKLTRPAKLSMFGGSNGGLLVGAVANQRPDLFAAALPAVGVMDMLRFHKFTAGRLWVDDYGSADDADEFRALYAYSPYHNIRDGVDYPAVMVTTADTDDRVVPGHSFKYAAALQAAQTGAAPKLIRIETRAGHGAGKPTDKIIAEYADRWAFLLRTLDFELPADYPE